MTRQSMFRTLVVCGSSLAFAARAVAAEEGAADAGPTAIFKWINFAIVAGFLVRLCLKYGVPWFRRNQERIGAAISEAAAVKSRADLKLRQAEQRLARIEEEIRAIREEAQRAGAAEADRLRALARSDAEKIGLAAKAEILAAERAAHLELKALAARLAVDGAESLLATELTRERQDALVAGFVKSLEGRLN